LDRADIVQYIDLPGREAIYDILRTCLCEVMDKGIVNPVVCVLPCEVYALLTLPSAKGVPDA